MGAGDASITTDGDVLTLSGITNDAGTERCWYTKDVTNISGTMYATTRWKTEVASDGLDTRVEIVYSDNSVQNVVGAAAVPVFSQTWTYTQTALSIPGGETVDKIRLIADDYPNDGTPGTYEVYYDFVLLHEGVFSFPYAHAVPLHLENKYQDRLPNKRVGEISQYKGMKSPTFRVIGTIDWNDTTNWGNPLLRNIYRVFLEAHQDPWHWFTSDLINCKATPRTFDLIQDKDTGAVRGYMIDLKKHDNLSCGSDTQWSTLQWLGL